MYEVRRRIVCCALLMCVEHILTQYTNGPRVLISNIDKTYNTININFKRTILRNNFAWQYFSFTSIIMIKL